MLNEFVSESARGGRAYSLVTICPLRRLGDGRNDGRLGRKKHVTQEQLPFQAELDLTYVRAMKS
ncbi:hypothetical protein A6X20_40380 [Bradyrhizobium elkanii]|nr:hypothetical protein A6X20_40380 [Bradyrhizobium elkanii]